MKSAHLIGILLITCIIIFLGVKLFNEGFYDQHSDFVNDRLKNYNPTGIALIAGNNQGALGPSTTPLMGSDGPTGGTGQESSLNRFPLSDRKSGLFDAIDLCEKVITADCSAFDDPKFLASCGLCLESTPSKPAVNSRNVPSLGGRVLLPADRKFAEGDVQSNFIPNYTATLGSCPANRLVATKEQCIKLTNQINCQKGANFDLKHCSQCYSDSSYHIVDPTASPNLIHGHGTLYIVGTGVLTFIETGYTQKKNIVLSNTSPTVIPLQGPESSRIAFNLTSTDITIPITFGGYLSGKTFNGEFNIDLYRIIISDTLTSRKPRIVTSSVVNDINITIMGPGFGQSAMSLLGQSAFTFIDPTSMEGSICKDTPFITTAAASEFLNSDPCYKKGTGPGKFKLECLQNIFLANGCTDLGKGYPKDSTTSEKLMTNSDGTFRTINDIANYVYSAAVITATGVNQNGQSLSIIPWSEISEFCTGRTIVTPCDTMSKDTGPLTTDCLVYLWDNAGQTNRLGGTYNLLSMASSLFTKGDNTRFCTTSGTLSPMGADGKPNTNNVTYWKSQGGVTNVKSIMDNIHDYANYVIGDMLDSERSLYINQCYGTIPLATRYKAVNTKCPTSGCGTMARYVRFYGNYAGSEGIHATQVAVYDIFGTNVAPSAFGIKMAFADAPVGAWWRMGSATDSDWNPNPTRLRENVPGSLKSIINGIIPPTGLGVAGNNQGNQIIEIDLGRQYDIIEIVFYKAINGRSMIGTKLSVGNESVFAPGTRFPVNDAVSFPITSNSTKVTFNLRSQTPDPGCLICMANGIDASGKCLYPSASDYSDFCGKITPMRLKAGTLLGSVDMPVGDYSISFNITPYEYNIPGDYRNIFKVTLGGEGGGYGERSPLIMFNPFSRTINFNIGDTSNGLWGFNSVTELPNGKPTNIKLVTNGQDITATIGSEVIRLRQPNRRAVGNNFSVYLAPKVFNLNQRKTAIADVDSFEYIVDGTMFKPNISIPPN